MFFALAFLHRTCYDIPYIVFGVRKLSKYPVIAVDTPSIMFAALTNRRWGRTFRLSADLTSQVDRDTLTAAVRATLPAYPNMRLSLTRGFFWAKQRMTEALPEIRPAEQPLLPVTSRYRGVPNFRLTYSGATLALESAHVQGDGRGHLRFFCAFLDVYARIAAGEAVSALRQKPEVMEDAFDRYYQKGGEKPRGGLSDAFRFPSGDQKGYLSLSFAETEEDAVRAKAHAVGLTVTQYLSAVLILAAVRAAGEPVNAPVRLAVPVDLRRFFPSGTCRNFVVQARITFSPAGRRDLTLSDVIEEIRGQLPSQLNAGELVKQINKFVSLKTNPVLYAVPYLVKKPVLGLLQKKSHRAYTTIFTNLGEKRLPEHAAGIVRSLRFVNGDTSRYGLPVTASCVSCNNRLSVCFSAATPDARFFDAFVAVLGEQGLEIETEILK